MNDLLDRALRAFGFGGRFQTWPVLKGNNLTVMELPTKAVIRAQVGDRIEADKGGFVEKITSDGWVQWRWYGGGDPTAPPLTGKVLQSRPARPAEP